MTLMNQQVHLNPVASMVVQGALLFALVLGLASQPAVAASPDPLILQPVAQLPEKVWASVLHARGVTVGGQRGAAPRVQVVFDPNCPYCALLYQFMQAEHPNVTVRWVPIAYLTRDSAARAGAILASSDPVASLNQDFTHYAFNGVASHGGYALPPGKHYALPAVNAQLQHAWAHDWGGGTPAVLIKNTDGTVTRVLGFERAEIERLLQQQGHSGLPAYRD